MSVFQFPFVRGNGYSDFEYTELQDHEELSERLVKTLYYGKQPTTDRPSLPLTNLTVDFLNTSVPKKLGKIDHYFVASSARHSCMSPCSMMMGMIYVNRLKKKNPDYMQQVSSSDLFLISMMMASKFLYDEGVDDEVFNDEWAASADMETEDINELERQFLSAIDWRLYVNEKEFFEVLQEVEKRIALTQGIDRGWFSYTDLWALSQDPQLLQTLNELSSLVPKVLAVSMVAYIAGILTVAGSTLLVTSTLASLTPVPLPIKQHVLLPTLNDVVSREGEQVPQERAASIEGDKPKMLDGSLTSLWTLLTLPSILSLSSPGLSKQSTSAKRTSKSNENSTGLDDDLDEGWMEDTSGLSHTGSNFFSLLSDIVSFSLPERRKTDAMTNQMVCAKGPCLFSGQNINCKNVSKLQSSWIMNLWDQRDSEQSVVDRKHSQCKHCEARKTLGARKLDRFCDKEQLLIDWTLDFDWYADVSCCCDHVTADLDRSLIFNGFADISQGFHTMLTPIPVLGT